jgi:dynein light chain LC8-type
MEISAGDKNEKEVNTSENLKFYRGARVFWPPDCPDDILDAAIAKARRLLAERPDPDEAGLQIATEFKKYMDSTYEPYWHVVCGRHFGCYAVHTAKRFIYFYIDNMAFLLYKSG